MNKLKERIRSLKSILSIGAAIPRPLTCVLLMLFCFLSLSVNAKTILKYRVVLTGTKTDIGCLVNWDVEQLIEPEDDAIRYWEPCIGCYCQIYRDGELIDTVLSVEGHNNFYRDYDVVVGREYTYQVIAMGESSNKKRLKCYGNGSSDEESETGNDGGSENGNESTDEESGTGGGADAGNSNDNLDLNSTLSVTDVAVRSNYPRIGLVELTCNVSGIRESSGKFSFEVTATIPGCSNKVSSCWILNDGKMLTDLVIKSNGTYRLVWDAKADLGEIYVTNAVLQVACVYKDMRDKVQLWKDGPFWATTNIGAEEPLDYGYYFWWGDTVGYKRQNNTWVASDGTSSNFSFSEKNVPTYGKSDSTLQSEGWITSNNVLTTEHDAATVHWGGLWRMPTAEELSSLFGGEIVQIDYIITNGVPGYVFRGREEYASSSIFIPAAGYAYGTLLYGQEPCYESEDEKEYYCLFSCNYWSSTKSLGLVFGACNDGEIDESFRGASIRPVQGCSELDVSFFASSETPSFLLDTIERNRLYSDVTGAVPMSAAFEYIGYLHDENDPGIGRILVKMAKPKVDKKTGSTNTKITVSIEIVGEKKVTIKGDMDVIQGIFDGFANDGRELHLEFGDSGLTGTFGKYDIDGARNFFDSKDKSEKSTAEEILKPYLGAYSMICDGGILSVSIAKKGKVTIKGAIDGNKVSLKAQALIGEDMICIPVIYSKKSVNLAFTIWLPIDGGDAVIIGLDDAIIGKAGTLNDGAKFVIDGDIGDFIETEDPRTLELLPDNETITVSKSKWLVADGIKPAKVAYKKGEFNITEGKKGAGIVNPSGLKLSYKSKDGSFTGSFTAYAIVKGKLKKHKATVEGILIGDVGYGTITIKKIGTWAVTIE